MELGYRKIGSQVLAHKDIREFIRKQVESICVISLITSKVFEQFIKQIKLRPMLDHRFYANLFRALFTDVEMDAFLRKSNQQHPPSSPP